MKIYIIIGKNDTSGGGKSLHQLAEILSKKYDCFIHYYDYKSNDEPPLLYNRYDVKCTNIIEDSPENIILVPEIYIGFLEEYKYVKKIIWWLSYDFYEKSLPKNKAEKLLKKHYLPTIFTRFALLIAKALNVIPKFMFNIVDLTKSGNEYYHLYNCDYVLEQLIKLNISQENTSYLCAPLSEKFFNQRQNNNKKNIVFYNPAKGLEFTNKIIEYYNINYSGVKFIPIKNMSEDEVYRGLSESKVYIDFGFFPGPERLPRESVMLDCVVITSKDGAAGNKTDVPIDDEFKFDKNEKNIEKIVEKINHCIYNYDNEKGKFDCYRKKVRKQKDDFEININNFFESVIGSE